MRAKHVRYRSENKCFDFSQKKTKQHAQKAMRRKQ